MKTTLTIADDLAAQLDRVCAARKARLEDVVNEALRIGLKLVADREQTPFHTESVSLGRNLLGNIDDISEALAVAEGEDFR